MKIAAIANAGASHQMAMCAIGRELQARGHEFLLLGTAFQARQLKIADVPFEILGAGRTDPAQRYSERALAEPELSFAATLEYMKDMATLLCQEAPAVLTGHGIGFVLADQEEPGGATAAELARLPYASLCNSLPLNGSPDIPPGFLDWRHSSGRAARLRNRLGYAVRNLAVRGVNEAANKYRRKAGLRLYRKPDDSFSPLLQITQLVKEFDFPRKGGGALHYVGPFQRRALTTVDFPFDRLNGLPLIYASFGTSFGNRSTELAAIAEACAELPVQLVISRGGATASRDHAGFRGNPVVVDYAPQRELLSRAVLAITHAGLNTTLEALSLGVPLLAMPIAGDQNGVAERIRYHWAGMVLGRKERSAAQIRSALSALLGDPQWLLAAQRMQGAIARTGGAAEAAEIIAMAIRQ